MTFQCVLAALSLIVPYGRALEASQKRTCGFRRGLDSWNSGSPLGERLRAGLRAHLPLSRALAPFGLAPVSGTLQIARKCRRSVPWPNESGGRLQRSSRPRRYSGPADQFLHEPIRPARRPRRGRDGVAIVGQGHALLGVAQLGGHVGEAFPIGQSASILLAQKWHSP